MISNIQMLRAIAVLLVLLCHTVFIWKADHPVVAQFATRLGEAGVDIFFVISGFIISMVADKSARAPKSPASAGTDFAIRRIIRIYPVYWLVFFTGVAMKPYFHHLSVRGNDASFIGSVFLVTPQNYALTIAWTLAFEMYFYALVMVLIFSGGTLKSRMLLLAGVYGAALITYNVAGLQSTFIMHPMILEFLFGITVYYASQRFSLRFTTSIAVVAIGVILFLGGAYARAYLGAPAYARPFLLGAPAALVVLSFFSIEREWKAPKFAVVLGDASYAIYLVHWLIVLTFSAWLKEGMMRTHPVANVLSTFMFVIATSMTVYWLGERPLLRALRKALPSAHRSLSVAGSDRVYGPNHTPQKAVVPPALDIVAVPDVMPETRATNV